MAVDPITERWAAMSHGRTRYFEAGEGPDVLLVHGAGFLQGAHSWLPVLPALAEHFHVLSVDCLGFGPGDHLEQPYSFAYMVDHLREFQDAVGLARSHVVGHSMGGWLGMLLAYESPERVLSLVDVAGGGASTRPLASMVAWQPPTEEEIRATLEGLLGDAAAPFIAERTAAAGDPAVVASFRGLMDHMTNPETRQRYNTQRRMPHIAVPVLVLWGDADEVNDVEMGRIANELLANSELVVVEGVGHAVARQAPQAFVAEVTRFVGSLTGA